MEAIYDGDRNTRYFHLATVIRRRHNSIEALTDNNDNWVTGRGQVKDLVLQYWSSLFQDDNARNVRVELLNDYFPTLPSTDIEQLARGLLLVKFWLR